MRLSEIKVNPKNPRIIKDEKFNRLKKSIQEFPKMMELRPMVVDNDNMVLGGNMRLKALEDLKYDEIPDNWIKKASELSEEEIRKFIILDNASFGEWDWDELANEYEVEELKDWGVEVPAFFGQNEAVEDDYEIPDEIETDIVLGDLFEIGNHRLLCGDATNAEDVAKVLNDNRPALMITDPPYGVNYDADWRKDSGIGSKNATYATGKVKNDDIISWQKAYSLFGGDVAYVWCASWYLPIINTDLLENDFQIRALIIWNKNRLIPSRGHYHWKHEPCWYAVKKGKTAHWVGDRKQGTIWDINVVKNDSGHSTQKPVECMGRPIRNHIGDVYDPFIGSGTTMVAANQLNRTCYGIEIDPKYCQVIIDRMLKLDPSLEIKKNGQPYIRKEVEISEVTA